MAGQRSEVKSLILTASGGPFRGFTLDQMQKVSIDQALAHPTWKMGPLVTINSATMVNKGLELIEAHLLFDIPLNQIEVVIHPESVVHSMVEFVDGSTIAQASPPDMRIPIAWGLGSPSRIPHAAPACDWSTASAWNFYPVDHEAFPAITLARVAGVAGGSAPAVFNGADEAAVSLFLEGAIEFTSIVSLIDRVLEEHLESGHVSGNGLTLENVQEADSWARIRVRDLANA
jgi:1-deoxy-D-xylulose-5-phosphate reductoisomerase